MLAKELPNLLVNLDTLAQRVVVFKRIVGADRASQNFAHKSAFVGVLIAGQVFARKLFTSVRAAVYFLHVNEK